MIIKRLKRNYSRKMTNKSKRTRMMERMLMILMIEFHKLILKKIKEMSEIDDDGNDDEKFYTYKY